MLFSAPTRSVCRGLNLSSRLTPTPRCRATQPDGWSGASLIPSIGPGSTPAQERVVAGFGVLQPRISFHLTAATRSRFAALLAISGGIDPYSTAASDAYMDLFGVGSFTGKGIYDVDAFEAATGNDVPREPHPQPRPDRGELRPLRPAQRHRALRRLSGPVPRLRLPRAPLGPRRLAALAVAGPARTGSQRVASQPAAARGAVEAVGQPAPQPCAPCALLAPGAGLDRPCPARPGSGRRRPWRPWRCRCSSCAWAAFSAASATGRWPA